MLQRTYDAIKNYLSCDTEEALDLAYQMNSEDGSFDWTETYDFDELCEMAAEGGGVAVYDLVRAAVCGETYGGQVRYDGYGNLIPGEKQDLLNDASDYLTDIVNGLKDYIDDDGDVDTLELSDELKKIIEYSLAIRVHVYDIVYDVDEDDDISGEPTELDLDWMLSSEGIDEDDLCDAISDETGWCIVSYNYEIV